MVPIATLFISEYVFLQVPDYCNYVKQPMDFFTVREKMESHQYKTIDEFETDFNLIVENCMTYNAKDTVFYRAGVKLRDNVSAVQNPVEFKVCSTALDIFCMIGINI